MKTRLLLLLAVFSLLSIPAVAEEKKEADGAAQAPSEVEKELKALVEKVKGKIADNKKTEADLADELKEFDALLAKHKNEKTEEVARIAYMKAMLYLQVLDNTEKGLAEIERIKKDFPDTEIGKKTDEIVKSVNQQEEVKKIQRSLVEGSKFPDFQEKDLDGKALSVANYKGKVVLIDFWATWCGPCVAELPNVVAAYDKHHAKGFEIIGISLDRKEDEQKLRDFIKNKKMPWVQFYDGNYWKNKLAVRYGVNSIPATYLLDGQGKIIGKNLRGESLEQAVAKALPK